MFENELVYRGMQGVISVELSYANPSSLQQFLERKYPDSYNSQHYECHAVRIVKSEPGMQIVFLCRETQTNLYRRVVPRETLTLEDVLSIFQAYWIYLQDTKCIQDTKDTKSIQVDENLEEIVLE
jgi:hypothetical protein